MVGDDEVALIDIALAFTIIERLNADHELMVIRANIE